MRPRVLPVEEIRFAARHGFLLKSIWKEFFAKGTVNWQNKRWSYFRKSGLFRASLDHAELLMPDAGHPVVKELAGQVSRPPRLEQLAHDKVIARSELLLRRRLKACSIVVETEAKRSEMSEQINVSNFEIGKYPDLAVNHQGVNLAIEVETTRKSRARYQDILEGYKDKEFQFLLYVVASLPMKNLIENAAEEIGFDQSKLAFVGLDDWSLDPFKARIVVENKAHTLRDLLS